MALRSLLDKGSRTVLGGLYKGARGIEDIFSISPENQEKVIEFLSKRGIGGSDEQLPQRRSESLLAALGYTPEQVEPKTAPERLGQNIIQAATQGLIGGGNLGSLATKEGLKQAAVPFVAGQVAKTGLEEVGAGDTATALIPLAVESGLSIANLTKSGKVKGFKKHLEDTYKELKSSLRENESGPVSRHLNDFLKDMRKLSKRETDPEVLERAKIIMNAINRNINRAGNIDIRNVYELRKSLMGDYPKAPRKLRPYIKEATDALKSVLTEYSPLNPTFGKLWQESSDLYKYQIANGIIKDFISDLPVVGKYAKLSGLPFIVDKLESGVKGLFNAPVRKYYFNLIDAALKDDKNAFTRAAINLSKQEEKNPQLFEGPQQVEVGQSIGRFKRIK